MSARPTATWHPSPPFRKSAGRRAPPAPAGSRVSRPSRFPGRRADGVSSGEAMNEIERLANEIPGTGVGWSGSAYEQRQASGQAPLLYAVSLLVVFLCLAALYESWTIPVAVLAGRCRSASSARSSSPISAGWRTTCIPADRPAHHHGPRLQERDPDDRVRRAGREEGRARDRRGDDRRRASVSARS